MTFLASRQLRTACVATLLLVLGGTLHSQGYRSLPSQPTQPEAPVETAAQKQLRAQKAQQEAQREVDRRAAEQALLKKAQAEAAAAQKRADDLAAQLKAAQAATAKAEQAAKAAAAQEAKTRADVPASPRIPGPTSDRSANSPTYSGGTTLQPGARFESYPGGPVLVILPKVLSAGAGTYLGMLSNRNEHYMDSNPYEARLPYAMAMGEAEVTFAQWNQCVSDGACNKGDGDAGWGEGKRPVMNISWNDIQGLDGQGRAQAGKGYLNWLNKKAGIDASSPNRYRLPTEAEWELAVRAGSDGQWSLGRDNQATLSDKTANYDASYTHANSVKGSYRQRTVEVQSFEPNKWGLYDMHGNVWEWVQDCYVEKDYERRASANGWNVSQTAAETANCLRVLRGGSWDFYPQLLRSANRGNYAPGFRYYFIGFRVARTLP